MPTEINDYRVALNSLAGYLIGNKTNFYESDKKFSRFKV